MKDKIILLTLVSLITYFFVDWQKKYINLPLFESAEKPIEANLKIKAPDFVFETLKDNIFNLRDIKNKAILVSFWASWCAPCIKEIPQMIDMLEKKQKKLAIIFISIDGNKDDMVKFIKSLNLGKREDFNSLFWVWDGTKDLSLKTFNVVKVPETILIDRDFNIRHKFIGYQDWQDSVNQVLVNSMINK